MSKSSYRKSKTSFFFSAVLLYIKKRNQHEYDKSYANKKLADDALQKYHPKS